MKCFLGISNFLEEISSLSHFIVFLYFFALISEEGFLISCYSLELCIQSHLEVKFTEKGSITEITRGREEGEMVCYYLRDTQFQFGMMKKNGNGQW